MTTKPDATVLEVALRELLRQVVREEVRAALAEHMPLSPIEMPEYIDDHQLAKLLGISRETIQQWRCKNEGPPWSKAGKRRVRYRMADVHAWMAARSRGKTPR